MFEKAGGRCLPNSPEPTAEAKGANVSRNGAANERIVSTEYEPLFSIVMSLLATILTANVKADATKNLPGSEMMRTPVDSGKS
jgi:hypothetical protein